MQGITLLQHPCGADAEGLQDVVRTSAKQNLLLEGCTGEGNSSTVFAYMQY
jgi:hypothetical protein